MKLRTLFTDDTAVSPVIGVILMVAITVILAAVIGTFVLGLGEQTATAPQASFGFDYNGSAGNLTITHESGQSIDATQVNVTSTVALDDAGDNPLAGPNEKSESWNGLSGVDEISAGEQVVVQEQNTDDLDDATVRLVWTDESGSTSATLQKWTGPDA
ncbi:type IV pilin [Haloferax namakaokahaiae]|uniref:Type IV pilin n=1 Tax=Haloferax namakaokahaiae TaxID=1748331 RepID=A0ABD5ZBM6_9EURY